MASPMGVDSPKADVTMFDPKTSSDLNIYLSMLKHGHIRPYTMPQETERLAERLLRMMVAAEEMGRYRDAMKCIELLRALQNDNRAMAVEFDRITRLEAGKPTSISTRVDDEQAARIKRIISTQRRVNTEATDVGTRAAPLEGDGEGDGARRGGAGGPAEAGGVPHLGDRQAAEGSRDAGAQARETGEAE
jgi:hypothetical protein